MMVFNVFFVGIQKAYYCIKQFVPWLDLMLKGLVNEQQIFHIIMWPQLKLIHECNFVPWNVISLMGLMGLNFNAYTMVEHDFQWRDHNLLVDVCS
jgi:hypothetical protein